MTRALAMQGWTVAILVLASACACGAIGCVANVTTAPARGVSVSGPPPAPLNDERPPSPSAQAAWVPGYWHWTGVHYAWIPGHWEQAPAGSTWAGPRYVTRDGAYFYEPGAWHASPQTPQNQRANAFH